MGSSLGPRFGSGLGSGSARARDYFSRALFGLGSVQGPDRGWLKVGARLRTRLGLAWPGSGSVSHKASSNMLTAGAAAPAVKPPAPAVESKLWHCGGQTVSSYLLKKVVFTLLDE